MYQTAKVRLNKSVRASFFSQLIFKFENFVQAL